MSNWKVTTSKSLQVLFTNEYPTLEQAAYAVGYFNRMMPGTYSDLEGA